MGEVAKCCLYAAAGCFSVPVAVWIYAAWRQRIRYHRFRRGGRSWFDG